MVSQGIANPSYLFLVLQVRLLYSPLTKDRLMPVFLNIGGILCMHLIRTYLV